MMATLLAIFLLIISVELFSQRLRSRLRSDDVEMSIWGARHRLPAPDGGLDAEVTGRTATPTLSVARRLSQGKPTFLSPPRGGMSTFEPPAETLADVVLVDYGLGNLRSATRGLERAGASVEITDDPEAFADADGVVLPGVGAFRGDGERRSASRGADRPRRRRSSPLRDLSRDADAPHLQ